jgi:putative membrane protein
LELEANQSVTKLPKPDRQREHQANERTFLAWLRTAIALIGFGFAIARFGLFLQELQNAIDSQTGLTRSPVSSQALGIGLVGLGILLIALAIWRYNQVLWQIERGDYHPRPWFVWLTGAIVILLGLLSIPLVLWRHPQTSNPPPTQQPRR